MPGKKSYITVTDQFCGAGGSSRGAADVAGVEIYLALNHDPLAVKTHNTNFPNTHHDCADISAVDPRRYPSTDVLITSPECTNHSLAKGVKRRRGQLHLWEKEVVDPAAERSRATMWDVPRFAEYHNYNIIITENVVDARQWVMWDAWILAMTSLGYDYHIVYFNSMFAHLDPRGVVELHDFVPQSRDRMYVVFWKKGNKRPDMEFRPRAYCPNCECEIEAVQAWKRTPAVQAMGGRWGRYGDQYLYACPKCAGIVAPYYFAAFNAVDWGLPIERIGDRDRPLKPKTIQRIEEGLRRFAGQCLMVETAFSHAENNRTRPLSQPLVTQSTRQTLAMAVPFLTIQYTPGYNKPVDAPLGAVTSKDHHGLVMPTPFISVQRIHNRSKGIEEPLDTFVAGGNHHGLVIPFLTSYYGSGGQVRGLDEPTGTMTGNDRHGLVMPFLLGYANQEGPARSAGESLRTIHTANGQGLVNPSNPPCVEDCGFRMLQPHEVGVGMAFPKSYRVLGNKRDQVRQYGNAVTPPIMRLLAERCVATLE